MKASKKVLKKPEEKIFKTFASELKVADDTKRTLTVIISTPNEDRSGDTMEMKGMQYDNFIKNPVVLFAHKYDTLPIAKCINLQITDKAVVATVEFTPKGLNETADIIYEMYKQAFLNAWSIGFKPDEYDVNKSGGYDFKSWELFEFSSVPVPDNPQALTIMRSKGINVDLLLEKAEGEEDEDTEEEDIEEESAEKPIVKGAIGYKKTPLAGKDEAWDGSAEVKKATVDDLKIMCAWVDSENADTKGAYKLPHHKADGEHAVVWNGVKAAGGAVQGARSKLDVPEGDLAGIKTHLEKHYHEFSEKAPWEDDSETHAVDETTVETKALPEGDEDNPKNPGYTEDTKITELTVAQLMDLFDRVLDAEEEEDENEDETAEGGKSIEGTVKKDVGQVIMLSNVLDCISWYIYVFEQQEVSQSSIDKLTQALGLVMQVISEQAELGKKALNLADYPNVKESVKIIAKAGRTISAKHKAMLEDACGYMEKAADHVKTVIKSAEDQATSQDEDDNGTLNSDTVVPSKDDNGKTVKHEFLQKLAVSLNANRQQAKTIVKKQNETLAMLEKIASRKGVK